MVGFACRNCSAETAWADCPSADAVLPTRPCAGFPCMQCRPGKGQQLRQVSKAPCCAQLTMQLVFHTRPVHPSGEALSWHAFLHSNMPLCRVSQVLLATKNSTQCRTRVCAELESRSIAGGHQPRQACIGKACCRRRSSTCTRLPIQPIPQPLWPRPGVDCTSRVAIMLHVAAAWQGWQVQTQAAGGWADAPYCLLGRHPDKPRSPCQALQASMARNAHTGQLQLSQS
jgi:hypothetical protein